MYTAWSSLSVVSPASSTRTSPALPEGRARGVARRLPAGCRPSPLREQGGAPVAGVRRDRRGEGFTGRAALYHTVEESSLSAVLTRRRGGTTSGPRVPPSGGFGMTRDVAWMLATLIIAGGRQGESQRQGRRQDRRQERRCPTRPPTLRSRNHERTLDDRPSLLVSALDSPPLNLPPLGTRRGMF